MNEPVMQEKMASAVASPEPYNEANAIAHWHQALSSNQQKALSLLGQGVSAVMVASTLGVSEGLVSQFLAEPRFANEVVKLKLATLQKQTSVDNKYLEFEDRLLDKFGKVIPMMTKPMEILKGLQVLNATKRRGMADAPANLHASQVVTINLPTHIHAQFITNTHNQIVEIKDDQGARSLITATPQAVERLANSQAQGTVRQPEIASESGWEPSISAASGIESASQRLSESSISETLPKGLRRSFENKGAITSDDL